MRIPRTRRGAVTIAAVGVLALTGVTAAQAAATTPATAAASHQNTSLAVQPNTVWAQPGPMIDDATGRCLDSDYNGNAYAIPCNGGKYQHWYVKPNDGHDHLVNQQTGLCLTIKSGVYSNLWIIGTAGCNAGDLSQDWAYDQLSSNIESWENIGVGMDQVLDSDTDGRGNNVGSVYIDPWNGGAYQKWDYE